MKYHREIVSGDDLKWAVSIAAGGPKNRPLDRTFIHLTELILPKCQLSIKRAALIVGPGYPKATTARLVEAKGGMSSVSTPAF
jgi:hypothetical protein